MKYLDINKIKAVPIPEILNLLGIQPIKRRENDWIYLSPWRSEAEPSLHVRPIQNTWKDFGEDKSGTSNIDLIIRMGIAPNFYAAAKWIDEHYFGVSEGYDDSRFAGHVHSVLSATSKPKTRIISAGPISSEELLAYMDSRCIPRSLVHRFCRQVTFANSYGYQRTALGFPTVKGGYAVRSADFKGFVGPGSYSFVSLQANFPSREVNVFEGFIDFLSFRALFRGNQNDSIITNSVSNIWAAIQLIEDKGYNELHAYLDADEAGQKATRQLMNVPQKTMVDHSAMYKDKDLKDLNDYLLWLWMTRK